MKKLLIFLLAVVFIFPACAKAQLSCNVRTPDCLAGETDLIHMSNVAGGHAELMPNNNYAYKVCCAGEEGLGNACNGNYVAVLMLDKLTNSQVEENTYSNYQNAACLSLPDRAIECSYADSLDCTALGSGYACMNLTISGPTNAHVADCDGAGDYGIKVCCRIQPLQISNDPIVRFTERAVYIGIGESYHGRIIVTNPRNVNSKISISLEGTYPAGLAKLLPSSSLSWLSPDGRNAVLSLIANQQKVVLFKLVSTDVEEYDLNVSAVLQEDPSLTGRDGMRIVIGFPASFPGIEHLSIVLILVISCLVFWKIRKE
jgi:hypothetical protein